MGGGASRGRSRYANQTGVSAFELAASLGQADLPGAGGGGGGGGSSSSSPGRKRAAPGGKDVAFAEGGSPVADERPRYEPTVPYDPAAARRAAAALRQRQELEGAADPAELKPQPLKAPPKPRLGRELEKRHVSAGAQKAQPLASRQPAPATLGVSARSAASVASTGAASAAPQPRRQRPRYPNVAVGIEARRVLGHWVKMSRRHAKAKHAVLAAERAARRAEGAQRRRKKARVDRVISLYMTHQEEVDRLCYEEPERMILTQIELLTRRIADIGSAGGAHGDAAVAGQADLRGGRGGAVSQPDGSWKWRAGLEKEEEQRQPALPNVVSWQDAFDSAMAGRKRWEEGKHGAMRDALAETSAQWREKQYEKKRLLDAGVAQEPRELTKAELLAELEAERQKLRAILPRFERHQRRRQEEGVVNKVEAFREEQRAAMDEQARRLREGREREAREAREAREREEEEEEEEAAERQRRQAMEEELRQRRTAEEEEAQRRRQAEQEEIRRREEEEHLRRQRMLREAEEERRERQERRRREEEEAQRQAEEQAARERRAAEARDLVRREEEERREDEKRRAVAEEAAEKRQKTAKRLELMDSMFDDFEKACDKGGMDETLDAAFAELKEDMEWTPPGTPPASACSPDSPSMVVQAARGGDDGDGDGDDWMARAMAALGGDDDESSGDEGDGTDGAGAEGLEGAVPAAADLELLRFTEAIVDRIEQLHGHG